jgi:hypothetical protein
MPAGAGEDEGALLGFRASRDDDAALLPALLMPMQIGAWSAAPLIQGWKLY